MLTRGGSWDQAEAGAPSVRRKRWKNVLLAVAKALQKLLAERRPT